jgi:hypothetical protein
LHISDLILKLHVYVSKELFLFKAGKRVPFMKSSMKITFYSPKYFQHFNVVTDFFHKVQIFTNYEKIILKIVVLSIAFIRPVTIFSRRKENNLYKKGLKTSNFRIKLRMCKRPIEYCLNTKSSHNRQQTVIPYSVLSLC